MVETASSRALVERLAAIEAQHDAADAAVLSEVASAVASAVRADFATSQAALLREVASLGRTIADVRADLAALGAAEITGRDIPAATDELDAVVSHTAEAAATILGTCEALDAVATSLSRVDASRLQAATTAIYEACCFQDITGQRIAKVIAALKAIDAKVAAILATGQHPAVLPDAPEPFLSGPQLPAMGMEQHDVDQLLARLG
jgi:chemotaxis protein CheZ